MAATIDISEWTARGSVVTTIGCKSESLYWRISTDTSWGGCCYLEEAVEAMVKAAEERGIDPEAARAIAKRKGKEDERVWGVDLMLCSELASYGSVSLLLITMQVVIHWEGHTSKGKAYPVAWAEP